MKKLLGVLFAMMLCVISVNEIFSQGVAINTDGSSADGSAMLDVKSTDAGILVPRLSLIQRNSIASPATGLLIFQTDNTPGFYYNAGTSGTPSWIKLSIPTDNFDDADADATNELQTISISDHDITLSDGGGTVTVPDNNTTYSAGNQLGLTGTTFNVSEGTGSGLDGDMVDGQHYSDIQTWVNSNDDNTTYSAGTGLTLTGTVFTPTFGTTAGTVSEGNHAHSLLTRGTGLTGNNYNGSAATTWAVDFGSAAVAGGGLKSQGNFGQFQAHATYTDFNANPTYWGWNYVQGTTNAPNATSSQWYRQIVSLGSDYPARGAGGYSLEMAFPRFSAASAGIWMRTVENGAIGGWTRIDGGANVSGTTNYVAKFTSANVVGNSQIFDNGTNVGIGTAGPGQKLDVNGIIRGTELHTTSGYGSVHHGLTGQGGQANGWQAGPYGSQGVWIENTLSEGGGFYADGDAAAIWSPGDGGWILGIYDEDILPTTTPNIGFDGAGNLAPGTDNVRTVGTGTLRFNNGYFANLTLGGVSRSTWPADGTPGGVNGNVQFNNSGVLGGTNNLFWDNTNSRLGIGTTTPSFKLHVPSGYIGTDYINTTDNAVGSGVTGIMVKAGDNYHRTANAAAVLSFLGVTAPTGDNLGNHTATTTLNLSSNSISNVADIYSVNNYGQGLVGVYSDVRYQNVWAMGTSWRLAADGTTSGNLYGLAWTHSNIGGQSKASLSHQLLLMENGVTKVALGSGIWTNYGIETGASGTYNKFNTWTELPNVAGFYSGINGAHFYPNDASYGSWRILGTRNGWGGIEFPSGAGNISVMIGQGGWGGMTTGMHANSYGWLWRFEHQRLWADGMTDVNDANYYVDPNSSSRLAYIYHGVGAYNVGGWLSGIMQTENTSDGHQYIPLSGNWGYIGTSSQYWYYSYAMSHVDMSQRSLKRNIVPLEENLMELVMEDIDKIQPSFYKFKDETDVIEIGNEPKFRPNMHLGVILDEAPDYIQDQAFSGVDIYALATLAITGVKYNRNEIKEIKEYIGFSENKITVSDFGNEVLKGNETWISFSEEFISKLTGASPIITVTPNQSGVSLSIIETTSTGFKVVSTGNISNITFNWIAMAKVSTEQIENEKQPISQEFLNQLKVDENIKDNIREYWAKQMEKNQGESKQQAEEQKNIIKNNESKIVPVSTFPIIENENDENLPANQKNKTLNEPLEVPKAQEINY